MAKTTLERIAGALLSERIYILPRDRPSCAMTVITNGSFLTSGYMFLNCSMQHLFDHLPILISDCLVKR